MKDPLVVLAVVHFALIGIPAVIAIPFIWRPEEEEANERKRVPLHARRLFRHPFRFQSDGWGTHQPV